MSGTGIEVIAVCRWKYVVGNDIDNCIVYLKKGQNYFWEYHECNFTKQHIIPRYKINRTLSAFDNAFKEGDLDDYISNVPS